MVGLKSHKQGIAGKVMRIKRKCKDILRKVGGFLCCRAHDKCYVVIQPTGYR